MNIPGYQRLIIIGRSKVNSWTIGLSLATLVLTIFVGKLYYLALLEGIFIALFIAVKFPLITILAFLMLSVWPTFFQMTANPIEINIGGGLRASDAVLLAMAGAVLLQILLRWINKKQKFSITVILIVLFSGYILYEILRNYAIFGLSAPGEFRFRYLILVLPLYVGIMFNSVTTRVKLCKLLIFSSAILPLLVLPIVGSLKGWGVGPSNRFFPSFISLGLVYGLIALFLARKYAIIRINMLVVWLISLPIIVLVLVDSHRSVWISTGTALLILIFLGEIRIKAFLRYLPTLFFLIVAVVVIATSAGLNVPEYISSRGSEIFNPTAEDGTGAWRLNQWNIEMRSFYKSPVLGIGFGGYWETGVSPHSLYVQTLVKLGAIGLLLYLAVVLQVFTALWRWIAHQRRLLVPETAIVIMGFVCLVAGHAYYSVYAFEEYTWLFVGLSVAAVSNTVKT